jgi:hypothetical protein
MNSILEAKTAALHLYETFGANVQAQLLNGELHVHMGVGQALTPDIEKIADVIWRVCPDGTEEMLKNRDNALPKK